MSGIDLSNPKVLQNHLLAQAKEGKGTFSLKKDVVIFKGELGAEIIVPGELADQKRAELGGCKVAVDTELEGLKAEAKKLGVKGFGCMKKETLIARIEEATVVEPEPVEEPVETTEETTKQD